MNELRAYMPFTFPVDPTRIQTVPEMDLSYALTSTLIEWSQDKQIHKGLAERWKPEGDRKYHFFLSKNAKWSDGSPIRSSEVKASLQRGVAAHPEDLRSFSNLVESIECPDDQEIIFSLRSTATTSGLLKKLTEPNYGILKVGKDGHPDLSKSTGAFYLAPGATKTEIKLLRNPHWHRFTPDTASSVVVRQPPEAFDQQTILMTDSWPNMVETSSLMTSARMSEYESNGFHVWKRPTDKVLVFQLSQKRADQDHLDLLRFLSTSLDRKKLTQGLSGFEVTNQIFPAGFPLHVDKMHSEKAKLDLPKVFRERPIEITVPYGRVILTLKDQLEAAVLAATGHKPKIKTISLHEMSKTLLKGEFDVFMCPYGLADPDIEGVMSFYFEGATPVVPSNAKVNFVEKLDAARKSKTETERVSKMRAIVHEALKEGFILPLLHLSTVGIGRPELDFSQVPPSDETITLSWIRFRKGQ